MTPRLLISFLFKHGWILFIAVTLINELRIRKKAKSFLYAHPESKIIFYKFWRTYLILENIPWLIIAIGDISGMTNTIFDFFFPRLSNPIVWVFHLSVISLLSISVYWVYFKNGAEFLATYPNKFNGGEPNGGENRMKILFALMLISGIIAEIFMWVHNGAPPNIHIDKTI